MKTLTMRSHSKGEEGPWYTLTSEGFIKGIKVAGIECVVKTEIVENDRELPRPKRTKEGNLIYAVPGGGSFANGEYLD